MNEDQLRDLLRYRMRQADDSLRSQSHAMPQQLPLLAEERATYITQRDDTERTDAVERLRAKLFAPTFRAIEGFPISEDEAILALSDPPHYTACPTPLLPQIVDRRRRERAWALV